MSAVAGKLIGVATRVGAPIVKSLLEQFIGGKAGKVGGAVIDAIAGHAGVPAEDLAQQPARKLDAAVRATEAEAPELIELWTKGLDGQFALLQGEQQEGWFGWAWRPTWMWLLALLWTARLLVMPIVDAFSGTAITGQMDIAVMLTLTGYFLALYMGGHTLKDLGTKAIDAWRSR